MSRYQAEGSEGEFEPGSDGQVLRNKLGTTDPAEMDEAELQLLLQLYEHVLTHMPEDAAITVATICEWHRKWLGNIYDWAGRLRTVNLSKGGFMFAAADQIPALLTAFERDCLARCTPCAGLSVSDAAAAIAEVHIELILIHPFRDGNGRIARLVADVMASQAGLGELDYTPWDEDKDAYIAAIHAGLGGDYRPMETLVRRAAGV